MNKRNLLLLRKWARHMTVPACECFRSQIHLFWSNLDMLWIWALHSSPLGSVIRMLFVLITYSKRKPQKRFLLLRYAEHFAGVVQYEVPNRALAAGICTCLCSETGWNCDYSVTAWNDLSNVDSFSNGWTYLKHLCPIDMYLFDGVRTFCPFS